MQPQNANAHYLLGQSLAHLGNTTEAISEWKRVLEINPERGEAMYNLFRALRPIDPAQAKVYEERFLALQRREQIMDRAQTLNNFALASAAAQDTPHAIEQLKEALGVCDHCPALAELHKNLGLIYARSGNLNDAERELRAAQALQAQDPDVRRALELIGRAREKRTSR
ncbi:MAG: tetratricopeptide repeat protein [Pseudomonadota bacterium]